MLKLFEGFGDIARHGKMYLAAFVVPIKGYADVPGSLPVLGYLVMVLQCLFEMDGVFFAYIFHPKSSTTSVN